MLVIATFGCGEQQTEILELVKDQYYLNLSNSKNKVTTRVISNLTIDSITITSVNNIDTLEYEFNDNVFTIRPTNFIIEPRSVKYNLTLYTKKGVRNLTDSFNVFIPDPVISNLMFNYLYYDTPNVMEFSVNTHLDKDIIITSDNAII